MPESYLWLVNHMGLAFTLGTSQRKFKQLENTWDDAVTVKRLSASHWCAWAIGHDHRVYIYVLASDVPIRVPETLFENQRWSPIHSFSKKGLLPSDRPAWSNEEGTEYRPKESVRLPSAHWEWEGEWMIDDNLRGEVIGIGGWQYAFDFPGVYTPEKHWKSFVRKRKWIRFRRYSSTDIWARISDAEVVENAECFIDLSVGGFLLPTQPAGFLSVWAVTNNGHVYVRTDVTHDNPEGSMWKEIDVDEHLGVINISVGASNIIWAVTWDGNALVRTQVSRNNIYGSGWAVVEHPEDSTTRFMQVSVGRNAVWAISRDSKVWFRKGTSGDDTFWNERSAIGTTWVEMVGEMSHIAVSSNDQVFATDPAGKTVFFRTGVTRSDLTGKTWQPISLHEDLKPLEREGLLSQGDVCSCGDPNFSFCALHDEGRPRFSSTTTSSSSISTAVNNEDVNVDVFPSPLQPFPAYFPGPVNMLDSAPPAWERTHFIIGDDDIEENVFHSYDIEKAPQGSLASGNSTSCPVLPSETEYGSLELDSDVTEISMNVQHSFSMHTLTPSTSISHTSTLSHGSSPEDSQQHASANLHTLQETPQDHGNIVAGNFSSPQSTSISVNEEKNLQHYSTGDIQSKMPSNRNGEPHSTDYSAVSSQESPSQSRQKSGTEHQANLLPTNQQSLEINTTSLEISDVSSADASNRNVTLEQEDSGKQLEELTEVDRHLQENEISQESRRASSLTVDENSSIVGRVVPDIASSSVASNVPQASSPSGTSHVSIIDTSSVITQFVKTVQATPLSVAGIDVELMGGESRASETTAKHEDEAFTEDIDKKTHQSDPTQPSDLPLITNKHEAGEVEEKMKRLSQKKKPRHPKHSSMSNVDDIVYKKSKKKKREKKDIPEDENLKMAKEESISPVLNEEIYQDYPAPNYPDDRDILEGQYFYRRPSSAPSTSANFVEGFDSVDGRKHPTKSHTNHKSSSEGDGVLRSVFRSLTSLGSKSHASNDSVSSMSKSCPDHESDSADEDENAFHSTFPDMTGDYMSAVCFDTDTAISIFIKGEEERIQQNISVLQKDQETRRRKEKRNTADQSLSHEGNVLNKHAKQANVLSKAAETCVISTSQVGTASMKTVNEKDESAAVPASLNQNNDNNTTVMNSTDIIADQIKSCDSASVETDERKDSSAAFVVSSNQISDNSSDASIGNLTSVKADDRKFGDDGTQTSANQNTDINMVVASTTKTFLEHIKSPQSVGDNSTSFSSQSLSSQNKCDNDNIPSTTVAIVKNNDQRGEIKQSALGKDQQDSPQTVGGDNINSLLTQTTEETSQSDKALDKTSLSTSSQEKGIEMEAHSGENREDSKPEDGSSSKKSTPSKEESQVPQCPVFPDGLLDRMDSISDSDEIVNFVTDMMSDEEPTEDNKGAKEDDKQAQDSCDSEFVESNIIEMTGEWQTYPDVSSSLKSHQSQTSMTSSRSTASEMSRRGRGLSETDHSPSRIIQAPGLTKASPMNSSCTISPPKTLPLSGLQPSRKISKYRKSPSIGHVPSADSLPLYTMSMSQPRLCWRWLDATSCVIDDPASVEWLSNTDKEYEPKQKAVKISRHLRDDVMRKLRARNRREVQNFQNIEQAINRTTWVKKAKMQVFLYNRQNRWVSCSVELEQGIADVGDGCLTVHYQQKKQQKHIQISLSEMTCVKICSDPETPSAFTVYTSMSNIIHQPLMLQASSENEATEWIGYLCAANASVWNLTRPIQPGSIWSCSFIGDVFVSPVTEASQKPFDLCWGQHGGHMSLIETGPSGVTWGLGFDKMPYVYNGGYGGVINNGRVEVSDNTVQINDYHRVYVYENQKWFPVVGWCNKGIFHNDFHWQTESGRSVASKDAVKLPSSKWQWTGDWTIDFNTPGGVDSNGWQYSSQLGGHYHPQQHLRNSYRRRRWLRRCRVTLFGPWLTVGSLGLADLSIQIDPVTTPSNPVVMWAVGANGDVLSRYGVTTSNPQGKSWIHVATDLDKPFKSISVGGNYRVWGIAGDGSAWFRPGVGPHNPAGNCWLQVVPPPPGTNLLHQVSAGATSVWAVDTGDVLWRRENITPTFPEGTGWEQVATRVKRVSVGPSDQVWIVADAFFSKWKHGPGVIYNRVGITSSKPSGTDWEVVIGSGWAHVSVRGSKEIGLEDSASEKKEKEEWDQRN